MSVIAERQSPSRPLLALTALGLVLAIVGGALLLWPKADVDAAEPSQNVAIVSQAEKFASNYNTYDAADVEDYQQRLTPLLTEEFADTTIESTNAFFQVLEPKEQKSADPQVKTVAIESQDEDSAKVMVVVDATVTNTDLDGSDLRQMRWILSLQKEGDEWLVDAFESVPAEPASGSEVPTTPTAPQPSGVPTEGAGE